MAAFECFDERDEGKIDAGELRYWLSEVGDRMKDEEVRMGAREGKKDTGADTSMSARLTASLLAPLWIEEATTLTTRLVSKPTAFALVPQSKLCSRFPTTSKPSRRSSQDERAG